MKRAVWRKAIAQAADPPRARHALELLSGTGAKERLEKVTADEARVWAALFSGSNALLRLLVTRPDWLAEVELENLKFPRRKEGLQNEISSCLEPLAARDYGSALGRLRLFKERQTLRIAARDLARPGHPEEITQEISDLADVCLEAVWRICWLQLTERYGEPWHQDAAGRWHRTGGCVMGLGKLGGQELNYSSDVDVIFVYEEEGTVSRSEPPSRRLNAGRRSSKATSKTAGLTDQTTTLRTLANHQFFNRLAESFVAELTRLTPEGTLYRIDLRLRPEGDVGPLSRSLGGYENYYAQWGQTWERMMLIKARLVAGDEMLAGEFLEMVQPFRYPRSINENVLREVAAMKNRIETEVIRAGELERNVKLGRGGIREIEFTAQVLQLLHAGRQPFLQGPQTLATLQKLIDYELLESAAAAQLAQAYRFLRDVEHRLQMVEHRQTHTLPSEPDARERLARLLGLGNRRKFDAEFQRHTRQVRTVFERILRAEVPQVKGSAFPRDFEGSREDWEKILRERGFKDIPKALRVLREFVDGPGYGHVSPRTKELALDLLPKLFELCPESGAGDTGHKKAEDGGARTEPPLSDPDRVVTRLDNFIAAYGARATLFELWNSNPAVFQLLVLLFDRSEFLAELAIRTPDLVDELVTSGRLRQRKSAEDTLRDLRHGLADADQHQWLRRYHQAELMRIGLRDILGLGGSEQYLVELSALADACVRYALEVAMRKKRMKRFPFAIIGLGKVGGQEIDYGSDLDLIFVADSARKELGKLAPVALEVMSLLSERTADGIVFHTDARLRPDGEKGLLVNTFAAYEEYYRRRAQLWEIQSLTRIRWVAGDPQLGSQFEALASRLTNFKQPSLPLAAFTPDWKQTIHRMRLRIEKERTPRGKDELAIKTGRGGLMDAEFIAQTLCLEHGWRQPNTLLALEQARTAHILPKAEKLIESYRRLRRVEGILRRWSYEGETVLPDDPAPYFRVSVRCGFGTPEEFRKALAAWRTVLREAYWVVLELK